MADDKKQERKPMKIGTHGHVIDRRPKRAPVPEYVPPKETLRSKDPAQWKAKKAVKQKAKAAVRTAAKKNGHRMGAWDSGTASCKNTGCEAVIKIADSDDYANAAKMACGGGR